jgi:membrane protease YdiL (CAAX protease family)
MEGWFLTKKVKEMTKELTNEVVNETTNEKPGAGKQILRALGYGSTYVVGQVMSGIGLSTVLSVIMGYKAAQQGITDRAKISEMVTEKALTMTGPMVIIAAVITLIILAIFFSIRKERMSEKINFHKTSKKSIGVSAIIGIALNFITVAVLISLPESIVAGYAESSSSLMNQNVIIAMLSNVIAAPIIEEIIFRGLIFDRLKKGMPVVLAAVISSLLFGLAHGQIVWMIYAMFLGLALCYVYHKTGSIRTTIALHMGYNFTSTLISALPVTIPVAVRYAFAVVSVIVVAVVIVLYRRNVKREAEKAEVEVVTVVA